MVFILTIHGRNVPLVMMHVLPVQALNIWIAQLVAANSSLMVLIHVLEVVMQVSIMIFKIRIVYLVKPVVKNVLRMIPLTSFATYALSDSIV
jgi:hypothetical protein